MKLGFVSAILPDYTLEALVSFAQQEGFSSVELMCWPAGKSDRRYAGVTHLDVSNLSAGSVAAVQKLLSAHQITISGLGYYPNPLSADAAEAEMASSHLRKVIDAAAVLEIGLVNTFIGRNPALSVDANWPRFLEVWKPLIAHAEARGVKVAIENCPMLFSADEWPGGKNLATTPAIWRRMFREIPSPQLRAEFRPVSLGLAASRLRRPACRIQGSDLSRPRQRRPDRAELPSTNTALLSYPKLWHTPKIPGMGDVRWGAFFGALSDAGYQGHVAIEVEDRAFEGSLEAREDSLRISRRFLLQYLAG